MEAQRKVAGFVGVGIIADKMIRGFCNSKTDLFDTIYVSPRSADRVKALGEEFDKVVICSSNQEVISELNPSDRIGSGQVC